MVRNLVGSPVKGQDFFNWGSTLEVIVLDNPRYLRRLVPEVREPTEAILEELTAPLEKTT